MRNEMVTNKEITFKNQEGRTIVIPKGSVVEKNNKSTTGFFISPSAFPKGHIDRHDAIYYGYTIKQEDID
jgi:hypothetical protein